MEECNFFRIVDSPSEYYRVTANGIHIIFDQNSERMFGVDFGHFCDVPESLQELKQSPCCVVCSRLFWDAAQMIVV